MKDKEESLSFIFTEWGFSADEEGGELTASMKPWKLRFEEDRWQALYDLGFQEKEEGSPSFVFLWRLGFSFAHVLLTSPLFPFLKEKMEVSLSEEELKKLMNAIPGGPGAEWIDENWLMYSKNPLDKIKIRRYDFYKLLKVI
ncbi:hypothetical protein [uncultured Dialister sp.]|uniref:hypothetical protein n=1 Tax=uncultured Dialister sp. TaxID=278064 RepID=UPI00265F4CE2|nr:hypothetical protein [uncultured Dialister sp.]